MLLSLSIKNYALIDSLEIDFSNNFSIITGETGAGKSILLGALGLVLGNRADLSSLKDKENKCIIEAQFSIASYNLKKEFEACDFDYEDITFIRREILPSGKSRAFVNDSPVNLSDLQKIASQLIDIHSQHQTLSLTEESFQIHILDSVANTKEQVKSYQSDLFELRKLEIEFDKLQNEKEALEKEREYNAFLFQELVAANLEEENQENLETELEQLENVELIKDNLAYVYKLASEEQIGVLSNLNEIKQALSKLSRFSNEYAQIYERLTSIYIDFQDVTDECFAISERIDNDPMRLEIVNNKLQTIFNLKNKHQVDSIEELLIIKNKLDEKLQKSDNIDFNLANLKNEISKKTQTVKALALEISQKRNSVAVKVSSEIENIVSQLGMPDAKVNFEMLFDDRFTQFGCDKVSLLFSSNKGLKMEPLKKIASGGEMSRLMLAVKSIIAKNYNLPTIIFDEIDTGVSGEVALKMGEIMKDMSHNMQVFAITHLPQIAAKGNQHYKVFKYNTENSTVSEIKLLTNEERLLEIAEMLSGKNISDSALLHAKNLLN